MTSTMTTLACAAVPDGLAGFAAGDLAALADRYSTPALHGIEWQLIERSRRGVPAARAMALTELVLVRAVLAAHATGSGDHSLSRHASGALNLGVSR